MVRGLLSLVLTLLRGRAAIVRSLQSIARGIGGVAGIFGVSYREYERIHGR